MAEHICVVKRTMLDPSLNRQTPLTQGLPNVHRFAVKCDRGSHWSLQCVALVNGISWAPLDLVYDGSGDRCEQNLKISVAFLY